MTATNKTAHYSFNQGDKTTAYYKEHAMKISDNHAHNLLKSLYIMASVVEARDPYTGGHLWRVSQYSRILAQAASLSNKVVARIALGGFLHDLGKVGVPDAILTKPARLTDEEYQTIKTHPDVGAHLLADHPLAELVRDAIIAHHETPDGQGYPNQLNAKQIPLDARIVGICDAFDAMTSTRSYRKGMQPEEALMIIHKGLGTQFDNELGTLFISLGQQENLNTIVRHSEPNIPMQECPICGPTIVVTRSHQDGDKVYCRVCGGEAEVHRHRHQLSIKSTMRQGSAAELEAVIDTPLIHDLVSDNITSIYEEKAERSIA